MSLSNIQSTASSAAYLNARFNADVAAAKAAQVETPSGFGQALNALAEPSATKPVAVAPEVTPVAKSESVPFASFIDNIDFSKFKSDPLHFGQFIPIEQEAASPASEQVAMPTVPDEDKTSLASVESLMGSIEAQLNYAASSSAVASADTTQTKVQDDKASAWAEEASLEQPLGEQSSQAQPASPVIEQLATASQQQAVSELVGSEAETQSQVSGEFTKTLACGDASRAYNAAEVLADVLTDDDKGKDAS